MTPLTLLRMLRSERFAAGLLLAAAVLGLLLANLPGIGPALLALKNAHPHAIVPGLDLSPGHWVSDGLLVVFFFIVAVELRRELSVGELNSVSKAALPAIAALGGVVVPAVLYVVIAGSRAGLADGWPIPTATDIAFALGVLSLFGRFIPNHVKVFLLALAVLDDLVGILIIAFFFTSEVRLPWLGAAAACVLVFAGLSRMLKPRSPYLLARRPAWPIAAAMWVLAILTWYFVLRSGIHATIAGVVLGFTIARQPGGRMTHLLEPLSNGLILPLFAFAAASVAIPSLSGGLSPVFPAVLIALPLGKFVGIVVAGWLGGTATRAHGGVTRSPGDLVMIGCLGGIGFTVALLMNELAFRGNPAVADEGTLAVLAGSGVAIVVSAVLVTLRSRRYRYRQGSANRD
ncbi:MAG TPA: Na+/H+ antiporter NhaA [Gryllotalpicola sp.]